MDTTETITHLSLCSGYEGIGLGLRRVLPNLREIAYVEREGFPCANLVAKMEAEYLDAAPVFTDVKTFPYTRFRHKVDILSGGFPCQPFSAAGKRKATEDPRHLFPFIANGIRDCKPRIVFLENVEGIISAKTADGESVLKYVLGELEGLGYRATAGIFSASEVGAPHQRKRVFILGYAQHYGLSTVTELRGDEEASDQRSKEESPTTRQSKGASGPIDVSSVQGCTEGSQCGELADTEGSQSRLKTERKGRQDSSGGSEEELGNPQHDGCTTSEESRETSKSQEEGRVQESQGGSDELADSNDTRLEGQQCNRPAESSEPIQADPRTACCTRWPARPSEPQYEWEEPRVVADTKSQQGSPNNHGREQGATCESEEGEPRGGHSRTLRQGDRETQPGLGRATNGSSSRVDRLRLLGNGVVPATAAKAFVTLIQRVV